MQYLHVISQYSAACTFEMTPFVCEIPRLESLVGMPGRNNKINNIIYSKHSLSILKEHLIHLT
jgi:hypothetical protein